MVEGLGKGVGLALLAVPMADAFIFSQAQFQRILSNYLGLEGAISIPHTLHCGGGAVRVFTEGTVNHLQVRPVLGRNSAPHDAVRDVLSHLVVQNGVTDAAGSSWKSQSSQSGPVPHLVGARELDWMGSMRSRGRERMRNATMTLSEDC